MDFDPNDLTGLTVVGVVTLSLLLALIDTAGSTVLAITRKAFSGALVMEYVRSHVLLRVFPILALAVLGHGIPQLGVPEIMAAGVAANLSLGLYLIETLVSLKGSFTGTDTLST